MKTLVTAFGDFLNYEHNSSKELLEEIPESKNIVKDILPVGYFPKDIIRPIRKHNPDRVIFIGMDDSIKQPKFETQAKNEKIVLKNPVYRFGVDIYSYWLKLNNKNIRIKKPISKDKLTTIPIINTGPRCIKLHTTPPKLNGIKISKDAGNYVCNYALWTAEKFIRDNKEDIEFYFIHVPIKLSEKQKKDLVKFISK